MVSCCWSLSCSRAFCNHHMATSTCFKKAACFALIAQMDPCRRCQGSDLPFRRSGLRPCPIQVRSCSALYFQPTYLTAPYVYSVHAKLSGRSSVLALVPLQEVVYSVVSDNGIDCVPSICVRADSARVDRLCFHPA